jgi:hypothetical protein
MTWKNRKWGGRNTLYKYRKMSRTSVNNESQIEDLIEPKEVKPLATRGQYRVYRNRLVFSREEFYDLVWKESLLSLSKKYRISDVGLRKICIRMNIPLPKNGHWAKIYAGKSVPISKLPKTTKEGQQVTLFLRTGKDKEQEDIKTVINALQNKFENDPELKLNISNRVIEADPSIEAARSVLTNPKANYSRISGLIGCSVRGQLDINIGENSVDRALDFLNSLLWLFKQRGHKVKISEDKTYVVIGTQEIRIYFREKLKKVIEATTYGHTTKYIPNGILAFKAIAMFSSEIEWRDGKLPIEQHLSKILAYLEAKAQIEEKKERMREIVRRREEQRQKEAVALRQKKEHELLKFKKLLAEANRWHQSRILNDYITSLESDSNNTSVDLVSKLAWMRKKADWFNPLKEEFDELLTEVDRNSLKFIEAW